MLSAQIVDDVDRHVDGCNDRRRRLARGHAKPKSRDGQHKNLNEPPRASALYPRRSADGASAGAAGRPRRRTGR